MTKQNRERNYSRMRKNPSIYDVYTDASVATHRNSAGTGWVIYKQPKGGRFIKAGARRLHGEQARSIKLAEIYAICEALSKTAKKSIINLHCDDEDLVRVINGPREILRARAENNCSKEEETAAQDQAEEPYGPDNLFDQDEETIAQANGINLADFFDQPRNVTNDEKATRSDGKSARRQETLTSAYKALEDALARHDTVTAQKSGLGYAEYFEEAHHLSRIGEQLTHEDIDNNSKNRKTKQTIREMRPDKMFRISLYP